MTGQPHLPALFSCHCAVAFTQAPSVTVIWNLSPCATVHKMTFLPSRQSDLAVSLNILSKLYNCFSGFVQKERRCEHPLAWACWPLAEAAAPSDPPGSRLGHSSILGTLAWLVPVSCLWVKSHSSPPTSSQHTELVCFGSTCPVFSLQSPCAYGKWSRSLSIIKHQVFNGCSRAMEESKL